MKFLDSAFLRAPVALMLGSMVFTVGFIRLVTLSIQVTTRVMRGESPDQTLSWLQHARETRRPLGVKSSRVE